MKVCSFSIAKTNEYEANVSFTFFKNWKLNNKGRSQANEFLKWVTLCNVFSLHIITQEKARSCIATDKFMVQYVWVPLDVHHTYAS